MHCNQGTVDRRAREILQSRTVQLAHYLKGTVAVVRISNEWSTSRKGKRKGKIMTSAAPEFA